MPWISKTLLDHLADHLYVAGIFPRTHGVLEEIPSAGIYPLLVDTPPLVTNVLFPLQAGSPLLATEDMSMVQKNTIPASVSLHMHPLVHYMTSPRLYYGEHAHVYGMHWEAYLDHAAVSAGVDVFVFLCTQRTSYSNGGGGDLMCVHHHGMMIAVVPHE